MTIALCFFTYSFLGWLCECLYCSIPQGKFINRGFLAGPYCPIYGCGALLVLYSLSPFKDSFVLIALMGFLLTSMLEYLTSFLMEVIFHTKWWDYTTYPYNIHGRICLKNSLLFTVMVMVVLYGVHPLIIYFISSIPTMIQPVLAGMTTMFFIYDMMITSQAIIRKNKELQEIQQSIRQLYDELKKTNIATLHENVQDALQKLLNSTNADEIILSRIDRMRDKISNFYNLRKRTFERLSKAFPTRIEKRPRFDLDKLIAIINKYRKKD